MTRRRWLLAAGLTAAGTLLVAAPAIAYAPEEPVTGRAGSSFAVIGDTPYGAAAVARFPADVAQLNADPAVEWVAHLGDIKSGSSECGNDYFAQIRHDFDGFDDPLVYTPGDNEWTDCHRASNGGYDPLERLAKIRKVFFSRTGYTLGDPVKVQSQGWAGYPENVAFVRGGVSFAAVHIVGSNNGLAPRTGETAAGPEQTAEVLGRTAADVAQIREAFLVARHQRLRAVVLMTQADMFDPGVTDPQFSDWYAYAPLVQALARESAAFDGPVYLFNGDSHSYTVDRPLADGSRWLALYGVKRTAGNLTRITVDGSANANDYLRVRIDPTSTPVLSWTKVPLGG